MAAAAGLVGRRRVLDSTPLYDAVATMDTVTLMRSALRGLLAVAGPLAAELRATCTSGDHYADAAKPQIDWDDSAARAALIDSRARDGFACLALLEERELGPEVSQAAELLASVLGQDLEKGDDGSFRIARRVAQDRIISTVDPEARHGHKTSARGFDGYKGHVAIDPDSEVITAVTITAGNVGDAAAATELLRECLPSDDTASEDSGQGGEPVEVYGDSAYGAGAILEKLDSAGAVPMVKVQPAHAPQGRFTKDDFVIDPVARTVTCPNQVTTAYTVRANGDGTAAFGTTCTTCPLRSQCTDSSEGRTISIGRHEAHLAAAREQQKDAGWKERYRATRPKVERKLAHLMRRRHGGRRARVRGRCRVGHDFSLLAAAVNLARMAVLGAHSTAHGGWTIAER